MKRVINESDNGSVCVKFKFNFKKSLSYISQTMNNWTFSLGFVKPPHGTLDNQTMKKINQYLPLPLASHS